jgi:hypothetical protein
VVAHGHVRSPVITPTPRLRSVDLPNEFDDVRKRLADGKPGRMLRFFSIFRLPYGVQGFEDQLPKYAQGQSRRIGEEVYYNTMGSIQQLALALCLSQNTRPSQAFQEEKGGNSAHIVQALRAEQALAGMKILDLGCGIVPSFALAAKTLGAEVHTADGQPLPAESATALDSHTMTDFTQLGSIADIQTATGGDFDFVTENMVAPVYEAPDLPFPSASCVRRLGGSLLREGGFLYQAPSSLYQRG